MSDADFESLEFIHFKASGRCKEVVSPADLEGRPCLHCGERCPGYTVHPWRKYCNFCKCPQDTHDLPSNNNETNSAEERMCVEVDNPSISVLSDSQHAAMEGYDWVPRGLSSNQIAEYMNSLPSEKVPWQYSEGSKYRARQLAYQYPVQDFSSNHCRKLTLDQKMAMDDMSEKRVKNYVGVGAVKAGLSQPSVCDSCNLPINVDEMAVFAERAGPDHCWHPACFVCPKDNELLVDLVYCYKDGAITCARHFSEDLKPRCAGCEELIYVGEYSQAMDQDWHPGHFCCYNCDESLSGQKYVTTQGNPICIKCYNENFASMCESCQKPIGPGTKDIVVRNKHWHNHCFICSQCEKALLAEGFTFKDDKLICHGCRGIAPSKTCEDCGEEFSPGEKKVGYQNKTYHERCFVCEECKQPIGNQQFIKRDDKRYCSNCFDTRHAKICIRCEQIIKTASVKHDGNTYHSDCFTCTICENALAGKPFTKFEGRNVCQNCYRDRYAKRCAQCEQLIEGSVKFVAYDEKFYHRDCFTCAKCGQALAGEKFRVRGEDKVCIKCDT